MNENVTPEEVKERAEVEAAYRAVLARCNVSDSTMASLPEDLSMAMWIFFVHGYKEGLAKQMENVVPSEFDVRTIMLDVVPGWDGCGVEVYAKNVGEVERVLVELYEKWETLADSSTEEIRRLRAENAALNEKLESMS